MNDQQNQPSVRLDLSVNQLNLILAALAKLPLEAVLETFQAIQHQASQQLGAPSVPSGPLADKVVQ